MKNKTAVLLVAATLIAPALSLWASAGDATTQGAAGTVTGTPQATPKGKKHHGGHHHHKKTPSSAASNTATTPVTK